jgi:dihydropteroate synthase
MSHLWRTARRDLDYGERALVMAILNVTPDSFSDGGMIGGVDEALRQTEKFIAEGADIIDIGGESTRPGSSRVSIEEETLRVVPVIEAITGRFDIATCVDTSKSEVAERAVAARAEIINDISALRFDPKIADIAAAHKTGLVLMHSRGDFESMHSQPPVSDIVREVSDELRCAIGKARRSGVPDENIVLDIGIGFGKTQEQNLELLAKLDKLTAEFSDYPV